MKKKVLSALTALALCLALLAPLPVSAADVCFTAINDSLRPLTADTMPLWSGGVLYVPYSVFDVGTTGINLGFWCSYSRNENTITLYNIEQFLKFDLNSGACWNDITGEAINARAIVRNGRPYLPVNAVCSFFGLSSSYTTIPQGYLVRIKSSAVVLSDARFIEAAGISIERRLREYNQSLNPTPDPPPATTTPPPSAPLSPADVRTYLAFRCESAETGTALLDALDGTGKYGLFLLTPQAAEDGGLVRRILGSGHSLGLLAEGADPEETRELLSKGVRLLEQAAHFRPTAALVPADQRAALKPEGWVYWNGTYEFTPTGTIGAGTFASTVLRRLEGRTRPVYLTLSGEDTARVLPTLLRQLAGRNFVVSVPLETSL